MDNCEHEKLDEEEKRLIATCGIYCGACDIFLGKSRHLAKELVRILDGFNFTDVASIMLEAEQEQIKDFLAILKKWSSGTQCPGCIKGGAILIAR